MICLLLPVPLCTFEQSACTSSEFKKTGPEFGHEFRNMHVGPSDREIAAVYQLAFSSDRTSTAR